MRGCVPSPYRRCALFSFAFPSGGRGTALAVDEVGRRTLFAQVAGNAPPVLLKKLSVYPKSYPVSRFLPHFVAFSQHFSSRACVYAYARSGLGLLLGSLREGAVVGRRLRESACVYANSSFSLDKRSWRTLRGLPPSPAVPPPSRSGANVYRTRTPLKNL